MSEAKTGVEEKDGLLTSILITINCCVAGSIFGVPWGFAQAGWGFSLFLSILGLISMISLGIIVLQVLTRMSKIHKLAQSGWKISPVPIWDFLSPHPPSHYLIRSPEPSESRELIDPYIEDLNIKYDFTMICKTLLGKTLEKVLSFLIVANSLVFLIGCTSSFASSMASLVPIGTLETCNIFENPSFEESCRYKYIFYIAVFSIIVSSMTLLWHFTENQEYLIAVCLIRALVIGIMAATCVKAAVSGEQLNSSTEVKPDLEVARPGMFGVAVPIIFLTMGFHLLIPDVVQPLKNKQVNAVKMLYWGFFLSFCLITILSVSMIFGCDEVQRLSTLNWKNYSNGVNPNERQWWTIIIELLISIYPCIDITSIFAMTAVNTADNIIALEYDGLSHYHVDSENVFKTRVVIIFITIFMPMYFYDLGIVFALAGAINVVFLFLFVLMFGISSMILVPEKCHFDNFLANRTILNTLLVISVAFCLSMWGSFANYLVSTQVY